MTTMHTQRVDSLYAALEAANLQAFLASVGPNVFYLSGSEEAVGVWVGLVGQQPRLLVQANAYQAALDSVSGTRVEFLGPAEPMASRIASILAHAEATSVGYDDCPLKLYQDLVGSTERLHLQAAGQIPLTLRRRKDQGELTLVRAAIALADSCMEAGFRALHPGVSELSVAAAIEHAVRAGGGNATVFRTHVGSGPHAAYCDVEPVDRPIGASELGFIDLGPVRQHYFGDLTRGFLLGQPTAEHVRIVSTVAEAQKLAMSLMRPGARCAEIYAAAHAVLDQAGLAGYFPHHLGHGMGLGGDLPLLGAHSADVLEEGDLVTVEPGVYIPGFGGVRIEDVVQVTRDGIDVLSRFPHDWILKG